MRGRAVESIRGHGHLAHRIFFDSRWFFRHAERSAPTPARRERLFLDVGPPPFAEGNLWNTVMNIGGVFCMKYSRLSRWETVAGWRKSFVAWVMMNLPSGLSASYVLRSSARFFSILRMLNGIPERM